MMPQVKILRVITRLNIGGASLHAVFLTAGLDSSIFQSKLVVGKTDECEGDMSYLAENHGLRLVRIGSLSNGSGPLSDLTSFWHLFKRIRKERPDLIHLHLLKARFLGGIAAKLTRVPVIVETFHGNLFTGYYGRLKTVAIMAAERFLGWLIVDRVIVISESQKEELIKYRICPARKIEVIPLGLELGRFIKCEQLRGKLRKELGLSENTILIGSVGRLVPIKGVKYLLDSFSKVSQSKETDFCLIIVGDGVLRGDLEILATNLGVDNKVRFLGWRFDLEKIYADLDIVVLSSLNEGTPVSLIEAMTAGKVVLATKVGGVPDLVEDGKTGVLVPTKNPEALTEAILRLLKNDALRRRLGEQAKASVYPKYDISRLVEDMKNFYLKIVPSR